MTRTDACSLGAAEIRPLLSGGRRVHVDGHPICAQCGGAVEAVAPDQWRHGLSRRPRLSLTPSHAQFTQRFPWIAVSESQWCDAARVLEAYRKSLRRLARRQRLAAGENPYLDLFRQLMATRPSPLLDLGERRRELASLFSWAIPTDAALDLLAKYAPLVECGAGMGYWLALLRARGVDALGYDARRPGRNNAYHQSSRQPWTRLERGASVSAARQHRERSLVLCWPPYADDAASYEALRAYRGDVVIHIGERDGATGSVRFHRELALNWTLLEELELPHWPRLEDRVMVYRRNAQRRAHVERDRCFECKKFIPTGAIGRCDECFRRHPPALALKVGPHRIEYPQSALDAMPPALRKAFEASPARIKQNKVDFAKVCRERERS